MAVLQVLLAAVWLLAQNVGAQFVTAPTDLNHTTGYLDIPVRYKQVPDGICETTPGVRSFSGYVDIEENEHIFFWFFEARNADPTTAPLTVWINGLIFHDWTISGAWPMWCGPQRYSNPYAWNNASNLLFIDQPTGTGFSYSDAVPAYVAKSGNVIQLPDATCPDYAGACGTYSASNLLATANSTQAAAPRFWRTLQGFTGAFPQYARGDLHFASESYGGHYGPVFGAYLAAQNAAVRRGGGGGRGARELRLRSVLVGNGWLDPLLQYAAYGPFAAGGPDGNTYDVAPHDAAAQRAAHNAMYGPGNCGDLTRACRAAAGTAGVCAFADAFCTAEVEVPLRAAGRDEYDIRELEPDPFPYEFYGAYLNRPEVQAAVGAFVNYTASSSLVGNAFAITGDDDREAGTIEALRELVAQGVYVVLYAGDADYLCNWLGVQAVAGEVAAPGFGDAGFADIATSDAVVHGQVKQSGGFAFARVYYAGHEVPFYQPLLALEMLARVIAGTDVATGAARAVGAGSNYLSAGPAASTFREGNATVQFAVVDRTATYNVTTGAPNPRAANGTAGARRAVARRARTKRRVASSSLQRQKKR